jgi:type IV secretory pathway VirB4 component
MQESLNAKKLIRNNIQSASTQQFLDINEIKDGVVILKNGALRSVLMVSSINFDLKSIEEQDAIIYQYQSFLNSLDFPIQILISSRRINLKKYIESFQEISRKQTNELLHMQTEDYIQYVSSMVTVTNIVNKTFYIVVPFSPVENQKSGVADKFFGFFTPKKTEDIEKQKGFVVYKNQLWQRVEQVQYGLSGAGIRMVALGTQELVELYYSMYNPGSIERLELAPIEEMAINTSF